MAVQAFRKDLLVSQSQPGGMRPSDGIGHDGRTLMDEDGKTATFEVTPASIFLRQAIPSLRFNGYDGEVQFVGLAEMRAARDALNMALGMAEAVS